MAEEQSTQATLDSVKDRIDFAGKDVLEIGCGSGGFTLEYLTECHSVLGIDLNPEAIERLRTEWPRLGSSPVDFRVADIVSFPLPENAFDIAVFSHSFWCIRGEDVVHVLSDVLRKVNPSLRADGRMLVMQPAPASAIIELEIGKSSAFKKEFAEPNFLRYLQATHVAIRSVLDERLFAVENESTTPRRDEYGSIDEWVEDRAPFCEDPEAFTALQTEMRCLASGEEHRVFEDWNEHEILLRKSQSMRGWSRTYQGGHEKDHQGLGPAVREEKARWGG
jgi:SAM-dependent methyltransferase